ncbi:MAG: hypothetical protein QHJ74_17000 [Anaerolineae bacterium]|jgi:hypothetical protein|nr:hypothetical protein [Anaerolineae bacterium]
MITATITGKGQVIFIVEGERAILIPSRRHSIMKLRGSLPATAPFSDHQEIRDEVRRQRGEGLAQETGDRNRVL